MDVPPSATSQLWEGDDHIGLLVVPPIICIGGAIQVAEVAVGAGGFKAVVGLLVLFLRMLHPLHGLLDSGLPDANLVFTCAVAHEVCADPPFIMPEGGLEDTIVLVVVAGHCQGEPDGHDAQW